jgi:hypothetical protein
MIKYNDFSKGGMVSVWVGNFASDIELDDYMNLSRGFEQDFGFELNERAMPETVVKDAPSSIAELVNGFSWSKSYGAAVADLAKRQGIVEATTMIVFLNFEYKPERAMPKETALLKFLGAVRFS